MENIVKRQGKTNKQQNNKMRRDEPEFLLFCLPVNLVSRPKGKGPPLRFARNAQNARRASPFRRFV